MNFAALPELQGAVDAVGAGDRKKALRSAAEAVRLLRMVWRPAPRWFRAGARVECSSPRRRPVLVRTVQGRVASETQTHVPEDGEVFEVWAIRRFKRGEDVTFLLSKVGEPLEMPCYQARWAGYGRFPWRRAGGER